MLKISTDYFVPLALQRLTAGTDDEVKETVELLLLYRQVYVVPRNTRLAIAVHLTPLLRHSDITIRYWSARALGEYHCPEVLPFLREALMSEENPSVRGWMQGAVAHLSDVDIDHLRRDLQSPYPETRSLAAQALFFSPATEARSLIGSSMDEDDRSVLSWKLLALPGPFHMRSRSALIYPADTPAFWGSNPTSKPSIDLLRNLLKSGDDQIEEYSIWNAALGRIIELSSLVKNIATPTGHASPRVREWAYKFLGFVPDRNDLPSLISVLDLEDDPKVRQGVVFAIGRIGGPEALEHLVDVLHNDSDDDVRRWAARAMLGSRIPWSGAESSLIGIVERGDSEIVIREILGALENKGSIALLEKLPIIEERAKSQGFALVRLLLSVASERMDFAAKDKLISMLSEGRIAPPEVTSVAYVMAEHYGVASRMIAISSNCFTELDTYRQGMSLLFEAVALSETDLVLCGKVLSDALDSLQAVRRDLSSAGQEDNANGRKLNPLFAFGQFYEELGLSYRDIMEGFESRLRGDFDAAATYLGKARDFYKLHESDQALSATERSLCSAIKLWLSFQMELTKIVRLGEFSDGLWTLALSSLRAAILRARDALRLSLASRLEEVVLETSEIVDSGALERIFDRTSKVNLVLLSIPVALDAPFSAYRMVKVDIVHAVETLDGVRLLCRIKVDRLLMQNTRDPFKVHLVFYLPFGVKVREIFSSAEVKNRIAGDEAVFERMLMVDAEDYTGAVEGITFQPLLRFADLELVCGDPVTVEVVKDGGSEAQSFAELRGKILQRFDQEELRTLCQDLGIDYDDLRGEGRTAKARELLALLKRRGRLEELREILEPNTARRDICPNQR